MPALALSKILAKIVTANSAYLYLNPLGSPRFKPAQTAPPLDLVTKRSGHVLATLRQPMPGQGASHVEFNFRALQRAGLCNRVRSYRGCTSRRGECDADIRTGWH